MNKLMSFLPNIHHTNIICKCKATTFLKKQKKISSVLIQQKSRRLSTVGASIEELEYTSNPFEWILNS